MSRDILPQYLQVYKDFSSPSYSSWFPFPDGCRWQGEAARLRTDVNFIPQFLQKKNFFADPAANKHSTETTRPAIIHFFMLILPCALPCFKGFARARKSGASAVFLSRRLVCPKEMHAEDAANEYSYPYERNFPYSNDYQSLERNVQQLYHIPDGQTSR